MKKMLAFGIVAMLVFAYFLTTYVSSDSGSQVLTKAFSDREGSVTASIIESVSLTPKLAKEIAVMRSASNESVAQDEVAVLHLGDFIDPDSVSVIMDSNSPVQHLGEELDPERVDSSSPVLSARHLGDELDPARDWYDNMPETGTKQEIGDYINADALYSDFIPESDVVPNHLGEEKDPEVYL